MYSGLNEINYIILIDTDTLFVIDEQSDKAHYRIVNVSSQTTTWGTSMECSGAAYCDMQRSGKISFLIIIVAVVSSNGQSLHTAIVSKGTFKLIIASLSVSNGNQVGSHYISSSICTDAKDIFLNVNMLYIIAECSGKVGFIDY